MWLAYRLLWAEAGCRKILHPEAIPRLAAALSFCFILGSGWHRRFIMRCERERGTIRILSLIRQMTSLASILTTDLNDLWDTPTNFGDQLKNH